MSLGDPAPSWAPLGCDQFSDFSLSLMTVAVLRSPGQGFCRVFLDEDFSGVFLMGLGAMCLRRKATKGKGHCPLIRDMCSQDDLSLLLALTVTAWLRGLQQVSPLWCYSSPFPVLHNICWKGVTLPSPHLRDGGAAHVLGAENAHKWKEGCLLTVSSHSGNSKGAHWGPLLIRALIPFMGAPPL